MSERNGWAAAVLGLTLGAGIAAAAWIGGGAIVRARAAERFVTVRGFSEREVAADLVIWPVTFVVTADDLPTLEQRYDSAATKIAEFLKPDFGAEQSSVAAPKVTDRQAQGMYAPAGQKVDRYVAEGAVTVRTSGIARAQDAMRRSSALVRQGVPLARSFEQGTQYVFTQLEAIKPEMIALATKDARRAAEQFAKDSGSRVGAIRRAQQGLFTVEDRDRFSPEFKKVRVVTTVDYFLE